MYFQQAEHLPPHFHAIYGEEVAAFSIATGDVIDGNLPPKAEALVREWLEKHKEELMDIWDTQEFRPVAPLR